MNEIDKVYNDFWKPLIEKDGRLDLEQLKKELYDYHMVLQEVPKVYWYVTAGKISKPNTKSEVVISESDDVIDKLIEEELDYHWQLQKVEE